ncbi:MAG: tetratricopeptide repeat protein, partial [Nitrospinae bacterium]|nr:tetratricopeptide repeat protein [Nitrospinota bacterium]
GSVRKADERVRISVRLVDAISGHHVWAERYDRELQDIFALQDEIAHKIVTSLAVKLKEGEDRPMERSYTGNQEAWDYYVRARELFRQGTKAANLQARDLLLKAIELDPSFARAYATLAATHRRDWLWVWSDDPEASQQKALENAQKAVDLDSILPHGHKQLAMIYVYQRQHDQAIVEAQKAVDLDINDADSYAVLAEVLNYAGEFHRAITNVQTAMRLDPYHSAHYPYVEGQAYYLLREYQKAEAALTSSLARNPKFMPARAYRAAVYWDLGQVQKAQAEMQEIRKVIPTPAAKRKSSAPFRDPAITDRLRDTWSRAEGAS